MRRSETCIRPDRLRRRTSTSERPVSTGCVRNAGFTYRRRKKKTRAGCRRICEAGRAAAAGVRSSIGGRWFGRGGRMACSPSLQPGLRRPRPETHRPRPAAREAPPRSRAAGVRRDRRVCVFRRFDRLARSVTIFDLPPTEGGSGWRRRPGRRERSLGGDWLTRTGKPTRAANWLERPLIRFASTSLASTSLGTSQLERLSGEETTRDFAIRIKPNKHRAARGGAQHAENRNGAGQAAQDKRRRTNGAGQAARSSTEA